MKIQRPGHTESNLLWQSNLRKNNIAAYNKNLEFLFIDWLYSTSGFYDKNIIKLKDNYDVIINSYNYEKWLEQYKISLMNSLHIAFWIGNPTFDQPPTESFTSYVNNNYVADSISINGINQYNFTDYNFEGYWYHQQPQKNIGVFHKQYDMIKNKTVLIISPFARLIEYQYYNINKIFSNFPILKEIKTYITPYTFLNNGPDNNFFETLDKILQDISRIKFDISLVSCGTYATFICSYIDSKLDKDSIYMGRGLHYMFAIDPQLDPKEYPLWITEIPKDLIYENSKYIENGIYWHK